MATTDPQNPECVFFGGTLNGRRHKRMMFGFVTGTILEPVYERDKKGDANLKDITHRQIYVRDTRSDGDGALGYLLHTVEVVKRE